MWMMISLLEGMRIFKIKNKKTGKKTLVLFLSERKKKRRIKFSFCFSFLDFIL